MLLQLLVSVVDAKLLEVVFDENLKTENIKHADEQIRMLSLKAPENKNNVIIEKRIKKAIESNK